jgi:signal transduction histidine kinase
LSLAVLNIDCSTSHEEANLTATVNERVERQEVKLRDLVEALLSDLHPLADASNTSLRDKISEELTAFADANMLVLIFQNLISNAITYTPNGEVSIGAREVKESGSLECWVTDNGAGIPEDGLERVFEKLESDPEKNSGMGLGLAIGKQFVEAHGGQVVVESKLDHGSTFRFTLPYTSA